MKKILSSALFFSLACSSPTKEKEKQPKTEPVSAPKPEEPPAQRELCLTGLSKLTAQTPPEDRLSSVLVACAPGCYPADAKDFSGAAPDILSACDVFCSDDAKKSKTASGATDWREVARVCGGDYYKLPIGQESLLTKEWAALSRVADYAGLSLRTSGDKKSLVDAVNAALKTYWILMPIPTFVDGQYTLPVASNTENIKARLFVRVNKGRGFLGALPIVMLTEKGAVTMDVPGLSWPSDVTLDQLEPKLKESIASMKSALGEPPASEPASAPGSMMMKTAEKENPDDVVLYVADQDSTAIWFVDVLDSIPSRSVRLAVASGDSAKQLKARFAKYNSNSNTEPTTITITPDSCLVGGASPLPPTSVPVQGGRCDAAALEAEITKAKISGDRLSFVISPDIKMSQLASVLDVASKLTSLAIYLRIEAPALPPASAPTSQP